MELFYHIAILSSLYKSDEVFYRLHCCIALLIVLFLFLLLYFLWLWIVIWPTLSSFDSLSLILLSHCRFSTREYCGCVRHSEERCGESCCCRNQNTHIHHQSKEQAISLSLSLSHFLLFLLFFHSNSCSIPIAISSFSCFFFFHSFILSCEYSGG